MVGVEGTQSPMPTHWWTGEQENGYAVCGICRKHENHPDLPRRCLVPVNELVPFAESVALGFVPYVPESDNGAPVTQADVVVNFICENEDCREALLKRIGGVSAAHIATLEQEKEMAKSLTLSVQSANDILRGKVEHLRTAIREHECECGAHWIHDTDGLRLCGGCYLDRLERAVKGCAALDTAQGK